jgi:hypothetical protein
MSLHDRITGEESLIKILTIEEFDSLEENLKLTIVDIVYDAINVIVDDSRDESEFVSRLNWYNGVAQTMFITIPVPKVFELRDILKLIKYNLKEICAILASYFLELEQSMELVHDYWALVLAIVPYLCADNPIQLFDPTYSPKYISGESTVEFSNDYSHLTAQSNLDFVPVTINNKNLKTHKNLKTRKSKNIKIAYPSRRSFRSAMNRYISHFPSFNTIYDESYDIFSAPVRALEVSIIVTKYEANIHGLFTPVSEPALVVLAAPDFKVHDQQSSTMLDNIFKDFQAQTGLEFPVNENKTKQCKGDYKRYLKKLLIEPLIKLPGNKGRKKNLYKDLRIAKSGVEPQINFSFPFSAKVGLEPDTPSVIGSILDVLSNKLSLNMKHSIDQNSLKSLIDYFHEKFVGVGHTINILLLSSFCLYLILKVASGEWPAYEVKTVLAAAALVLWVFTTCRKLFSRYLLPSLKSALGGRDLSIVLVDFIRQMHEESETGVPKMKPQFVFDGKSIASVVGLFVTYNWISEFSSGMIGKKDATLAESLRVFFSDKRLSDHIGESGRISNCVAFFVKLINFCGAKVAHMLGYPEWELIASSEGEVADFIRLCGATARTWEANKRPLDMDVVDEANAVKARYLNLLKTHSANGSIRATLTTAYGFIKPMVSAIERANIGMSSAREPPVAVFIAGPPGVGKSAGVNHLIRDIQGRYCTPAQIQRLLKDPNALTYNRLNGCQFWNGFTGQPFFNMEEIGQEGQKMVSGTNSYFDFIRVVNCAPTQADMADLDSKGALYITPDCVFATSNTEHFREVLDGIVWCVEAFTRRMELPLYMVPCADVCIDGTVTNLLPTRRLDKEKLRKRLEDLNAKQPEGSKKILIDYSIFEYHFWDFLNGTGGPCKKLQKEHGKLFLNYYELRDLTLERLFERRKRAVVNADNIRDIIETAIKDRSDYQDIKEKVGLEPQADFPIVMPVVAQGAVPSKESVPNSYDVWNGSSFMEKALNVLGTAISIPIDICDDIKEGYYWYTKVDIGFDRDTNREKTHYTAAELEHIIGDLYPVFYLNEFHLAFPRGMAKGAMILFIDETFTRTPVSNWVRCYVNHGIYNMYDFVVNEKWNGKPLNNIATVIRYLGIFAASFATVSFIKRLWAKPSIETVHILMDEHGDDPIEISSDLAEQYMAPQSKNGRDMRRPGKKERHRSKNIRKTKATKYRPQADISDIANHSKNIFMNRIFKHNVYEVMKPGDSTSSMGSMIYIKDELAIIPKHFIYAIESHFDAKGQEASISIRSFGAKSIIQSAYLKDLTILSLTDETADEDFLLIRTYFGRTHSNITKYFISRDDKRLADRFKVFLYVRHGDVINGYGSVANFLNPDEASYEFENHTFKTHAIAYGIPTVKGDCGSVLTLNDKAGNAATIMGMHIAGDSKSLGMSVFLSKEKVDAIVKAMEDSDWDEPDIDDTAIVPQADFSPDPEIKPGLSKKTVDRFKRRLEYLSKRYKELGKLERDEVVMLENTISHMNFFVTEDPVVPRVSRDDLLDEIGNKPERYEHQSDVIDACAFRNAMNRYSKFSTSDDGKVVHPRNFLEPQAFLNKSELEDWKVRDCDMEMFYSEPVCKDGVINYVQTTMPDCNVPSNFLGLHELSQKVHAPTETSLVPTRLMAHQDELGVMCKVKPANLKPFRNADGIMVDPVTMNSQQYSAGTPLFNETAFARMTGRLAAIHANKMVNKYDLRPYSFEVAVKGVDGDPFCKSINRFTSSGYPRSGFYGAGKVYFFGADDQFDLDRPESRALQAEVERQDFELRRGKVQNYVHMEFAKDETLPSDKVDAGKVRIISASPLDMTILMRKYLLPFIVMFYKNRLITNIAPGVNPFEFDWTLMVDLLTEKQRSRLFAGDFKWFDKSVIAFLMRCVVNYLKRFASHYTDEDWIAVQTLMASVLASVHVANGGKYIWFSSMPSGSIITTFFNSFINLFGIMYAIIDAEFGVEELSKTNHEAACNLVDKAMDSFFDKYNIITFGDDSLVSARVDLPLEPMQIAASLKKLGFTWTDEIKDGKIGQWKTIKEVMFLKRGFLWDKTLRRYLCPLSLDSILQSIFYRSKKMSDDDVADSIYQIAKELSLHSMSVFERYFRPIEKLLLREYGYVVPKRNYKQLRADVLSTEFTF